jgi:hypothetical protein
MRARIIAAALIVAALGAPLQAQTPPAAYWESEAARRYLAAPSPPPAFALPGGANLRDTSIGQPFPVLGLVRDFYNPAPASNTRETFLEPNAATPAESWWPSCAKVDPAVSKAESAGWITVNYDFGCVHVSIAADVTDAQGTATRSETLQSNADRLGDRVSAADEADDVTKITSVSWDINRNRVPNVVTIDCLGEGRSFCQDRAAQAMLIARLSIVGGSRMP